MATVPTAEDIRASSKFDFEAQNFPAGADPDPLQVCVDQASAYLTNVTARTWTNPDPPDLVLPVLNQALQMRTEQIVMADNPDQIETAGDFDMIASFSAGSYTETRRDNKVPQPKMLNPWPALNDLLWLLMTLTPGEIAAGGNPAVEQRFDYWRWMLGIAPVPPAWASIEVDWAEGLGQGGEMVYPMSGYPTPMDFPPGY